MKKNAAKKKLYEQIMILRDQPKNHQPCHCRRLMPLQLFQFRGDGLEARRRKKLGTVLLKHIKKEQNKNKRRKKR